MSVNKTSSNTSVRDKDTGDFANVNLKSDGVNYGLEVIADVRSIGSGILPTLNNSLRYWDMGPTHGGVVRETPIGGTFTDIYNKDASGLFFGFLSTMENGSDDWAFRVLIDGVDILNGTTGLSTKDFKDDQKYNLDVDNFDNHPFNRICIQKDTINYSVPSDFPISFSTNVTVKVRYTKGGTKKWRAGLVIAS